MTMEVRDLEFHYPGGEPVFRAVDFTLERGEVFAILGANGVGKTTLLNCVANQASPSGGDVRVDGRSIRRMSRNDFARIVAYVPQFHQPVFPYTVRNFVTMGRAPYLRIYESPRPEDAAVAMEKLALLGVAHLADTSYLELSGGQRQLVMVAQALAQEPEYLILDEPTSHLDFGNQIRSLRLIERLAADGHGVLLTSHHPDHSLMFNHTVGVMHEKRFIALAQADDAITRENMEKIYGVDVAIEEIAARRRKICLPL